MCILIENDARNPAGKKVTYAFPIHLELHKFPEWTLFYLHDKV
jgi:hypothetical protein